MQGRGGFTEQIQGQERVLQNSIRAGSSSSPMELAVDTATASVTHKTIDLES